MVVGWHPVGGTPCGAGAESDGRDKVMSYYSSYPIPLCTLGGEVEKSEWGEGAFSFLLVLTALVR